MNFKMRDEIKETHFFITLTMPVKTISMISQFVQVADFSDSFRISNTRTYHPKGTLSLFFLIEDET